MTNYTQTTFFTPKDTLPATDPNKTIFGAAYDVEFGNIATAIASKPDATTVASFLNVNVTGNGLPANGIYLPSTNVLGFATNTILRMSLAANGGLFMAGATGGSQGAGTINATGLFVNGVAVAGATTSTGISTFTFNGIAGSPTGNMEWWTIGNFAFIQLGSVTGTSNATTFTITGVPAQIQPNATCNIPVPVWTVRDNGVLLANVQASITGGTITMNAASAGNGWTASGNKGVVGTFVLIYPIVT